ncbi:TetR family transcriptional regulator [Kribbella orskensis]|uniref:TetR family transcriptional regulator n=1 Tax=Kribbella orskensis TaxID=2512216 RepID=A0ABY2BTB7_9ACTN|nr:MULTISPECIES: TetR/AcrR family transcriptional regulator [Kribbella]TCN42777.1 TetR family transcriptional regulator [Kribbella sp. VKM Ac-2500]TCO29867.1 TetR family transcriptional regulator [Kribbella orskensis]
MPRDTLTRDQIVDAAVGLLDDGGLEGLNMRALGKRLGSAATAVYWHVGSKSNLIGLAGDRVWDEITLADLSTSHWRSAATTMATDLQAMLARHTWLVQAFGAYLMFGPRKARHDEHNLAIYETAGFTPAQADQAAAAVFTFVLGSAIGTAAAASLRRELSRDGEKLMDAGMTEAKEVAAQFPRLRARLETAGAGYGAAPDSSFDFGLEAILDGVQAQLVTVTPKQT